MHNQENLPKKSKLAISASKISHKISNNEKQGWTKSNSKSDLWFKTLSVKVREPDYKNLEKIVNEINLISDRKIYSDSEVLRGIINYMSQNLKQNKNKLLESVQYSS